MRVDLQCVLEQARSNTWVSFGSAQPSKLAQFSVGDNKSEQFELREVAHPFRLAAHTFVCSRIQAPRLH